MEKFKNYISKNKIFIVSLIVATLITSLVTILAIQKLSSTSNNSLSFYLNKIDKLNNNLEKFSANDKDSVDITNATTVLNKNISTLTDLKDKLTANATSFNTDITNFNNVASSIESTQNLYVYCLNIISSQENEFLFTSDDFEALINQCKSSYENLSSIKDINFTDDTLSFFHTISNYLNSKESLVKYNSIKQAKSEVFNKKYSETVTAFSELLQDLKPAIIKIREDNRSLDVVIQDIKEKEINFAILKRNFYSISIPDTFLDCYNSLSEIFNLYDLYLNTLKTAVIYEKSSSSYEDNKENIDKYYTNAFSKFDDVKSALNTIKNTPIE